MALGDKVTTSDAHHNEHLKKSLFRYIEINSHPGCKKIGHSKLLKIVLETALILGRPQGLHRNYTEATQTAAKLSVITINGCLMLLRW